MEIKILGSVSPYCTNSKNCPGILIKSSDQNILLDCGPGISNQLDMNKDLNNLTIIISHYHQDHFAELLSLALTSYVYHNLGYLKNKIKIYLPKPNNETILHYRYLTNLGPLNYWNIYTYDENTIIKISDTLITFSPNPHDIPSYAIKVSNNNQVLVYSGDTGYQGNTIESFAYNSNLLICESTFLNHQNKNRDFHLYAHEAALIAKKAQVKELILTHFWPEIPKEEYLNEALEIFPYTSCAIEGKKLILKK